MKKIILLVLTSLSLMGCDEAMTNEQVIAEKDKCVKANMRYEVVFRGYTPKPYSVNCY
jgi:hypothetical protein